MASTVLRIPLVRSVDSTRRSGLDLPGLKFDLGARKPTAESWEQGYLKGRCANEFPALFHSVEPDDGLSVERYYLGVDDMY